MPNKKTYYTSRTPTVMYQKCNRARYLAYHHLDTGITKDSLYLPFVVGGAVHKGLETLLSDFIGVNELPDIHSPEFHASVKKACESARGEFLTAIEGSPYDLTALDAKLATLPTPPANDPFSSIPSMEGSVDPRSEYILYLTEEQCALSEMLVATYAFSEQGLRLLLKEYEVLEVEQEDSFLLGETEEWQLMWESRADGLLRRHSDDALVVLSFKTASKVDGRTTDSGESDMQGMSEVVSVEKRLTEWGAAINGLYGMCKQENIAPPTKVQIEALIGIPPWFVDRQRTSVEAVQMVFLIKGSQKEDSKGRDLQENSLLRPWVRRGAFDEGDDWRFNARWEATGPRGGKKWETLGSEYVRVNLWEEAKKLECELWELVYAFSQAKDDLTGQSPLDRWLVTPNVHRREPEVLERWLRQTRLQEMRIAEGLHKMRQWGDIEKESHNILDEIFPLTGSGDGKCAYWSGGFRSSKCPFFDCCWGSRYYFEEPMTSGFKPREANHPGEREALKLVNIAKKGE